MCDSSTEQGRNVKCFNKVANTLLHIYIKKDNVMTLLNQSGTATGFTFAGTKRGLQLSTVGTGLCSNALLGFVERYN